MGREMRASSESDLNDFVNRLRQARVSLRDQSRKIPFFELRQIVRDMVLGLQEMSKAGVVHGDIKPDNLLAPAAPFFSKDHLQWTDFGFAGFVQSRGAVERDRNPAGGTVDYGPPELLAASNVGDVQDSTPAFDMFSVGLIAFELLTGSSLKTCAVDDGKEDIRRLVLPVGYVQYSPIAYVDVRSEGRSSYENMPAFLRLLQVLGLPEQDPETLIVQDQDHGFKDIEPAPYGNPYAKQNFHRKKFYTERALFAIHAAITGKYASDEKRDALKVKKLLSKEKYFGSKLHDCARMLLAKHDLELDDARTEALNLISAMLAILPSERISVEDALNHPWLTALE